MLEMSDAIDGPWTNIVEGQLTFPNPVFLLEKFPLNQTHSGRFIKFTAVNCYGSWCALTFIEAVASEDGPRLNDYHISTEGSFPSKIYLKSLLHTTALKRASFICYACSIGCFADQSLINPFPLSRP